MAPGLRGKVVLGPGGPIATSIVGCRKKGGLNTVRRVSMFVLSRKKHESIIIDGVIRVEVANPMKGMVRLRLVAPRTLGVVVASSSADGSANKADHALDNNSSGLDQLLNVTMAAREVIRLGESISLGVVDSD